MDARRKRTTDDQFESNRCRATGVVQTSFCGRRWCNGFTTRGESEGPGTGTSDDIPAMLSDGEFVMTAKAVRGAGGGDRREGAKRMYQMMDNLEARA